MNGNMQFHPLDNLIGNQSYSFLEAMVPFVEYPYKKPLVLFIKYQELMSIFRALDDISYVDSCGFNCHPSCMEDMINDMCHFLPGNFASSIKQMQQMMQMMEFMNMASATSDNSNTYGNDNNTFNHMHDSNASDTSQSSLYDSVMSILNEADSQNQYQ